MTIEGHHRWVHVDRQMCHYTRVELFNMIIHIAPFMSVKLSISSLSPVNFHPRLQEHALTYNTGISSPSLPWAMVLLSFRGLSCSIFFFPNLFFLNERCVGDRFIRALLKGDWIQMMYSQIKCNELTYHYLYGMNDIEFYYYSFLYMYILMRDPTDGCLGKL